MIKYFIAVLVSIIALLGVILYDTKSELKEAREELAQIAAIAESKNQQLQAAYDRQLKDDEVTQNELQTLRTQLANVPVRVRYITKTITVPGSQDSAGSSKDTTETYGVLPERNSQELKRLIGEIEEINAAYKSCRDTLLARQLIVGSSNDPLQIVEGGSAIIHTIIEGE